MSRYNAYDVGVANATSRNRGAVGAKALVPRVVRERYHGCDGLRVLDFGSGKGNAHVEQMRCAMGVFDWTIEGWEFGNNVGPGHLQEASGAYEGMFDVVYLSNVLNVQGCASMMWETLYNAREFMQPEGRLVCNYPSSPRKSDRDADGVEHMLGAMFGHVTRVAGTKQAPVWECHNVDAWWAPETEA